MEKERLLLGEEERLRKILSNCLLREGFHLLENEACPDSDDAQVVLVSLSVMIADSQSLEQKREKLLTLTSPMALLAVAQGRQGEGENIAEGLLYNAQPIIMTASPERGQPTTTRDLPDMILGELEIRVKERVVLLNGGSIKLTRKEFDLLAWMVHHKNLVLTRAQLLDMVWGMGYDGNVRTVDTHVKRIRAKLGEFGNHIITLRGVGYRFFW